MAHILIVEDAPITAKMEARHLSQAGHQCRLALSGREALDLVKTDPPDLIALDYMLPDINGLEVLEAILKDNPRALVVMVTGKGGEKLAAEVMKAGARDYVIKNDHFFEPLVHVVEQVLREEQTKKELEEKARQNERLEAQNELSFWMAHNFRNILSGAAGFLELLDFNKDDLPIEELIYFKNQALSSLNRALELVNQLVDIADSQPKPPEKTILDDLVDQAWKNVRNQLASTTGKQSGAVEFQNRTKGFPPVNIYRRDVRLALENILKNAAEAIGDAGQITVSAEINDENMVNVKIRDNGRGMDAQTLQKAFDPLFSTKRTVGVGLGLSLAQAALRRHNGDIHLEFVPSRGTTVTLSWPLHPQKPGLP